LLISKLLEIDEKLSKMNISASRNATK